MSITVAVFVQKKPELSSEEFQTAYDQYLPKLKATLGEEAKPESVTRYYVRKSKSDPSKPLSYTKDGDDFKYDLIAFLTFADEGVARKFQEKYAEHKDVLAGHLDKIAVVSESRLIGVSQ
ncbi:hypothetical protein K458DRAFT_409336 [Lentithecium fluviatile CBS 122367]|uniref:EthD domain-containing protein n=1 Tax=Lentithecium fluviatile CBS 122367 TaxID=1168545 RepID=A0A6G1IID0_9PLEO|nr:hypothetical protein K458DRAFT_409336 [Lentithecium fluviatile CBS 122367]